MRKLKTTQLKLQKNVQGEYPKHSHNLYANKHIKLLKMQLKCKLKLKSDALYAHQNG